MRTDLRAKRISKGKARGVPKDAPAESVQLQDNNGHKEDTQLITE